MPNTILIVEDDELNMKLATDLLHAVGYLTIQSTDGDDAEDLARTHSPNLILMDIRLPKRSGLQIIKSLKGIPDVKSIPIIATTAFAQYGTKETCLECGCVDYLPKPLSLSSFWETIHKHLPDSDETTNIWLC